MAALSRRLDRPELLASMYPGARRELREQIAMRALLAGTLGADGMYVDVGTNRGQLLAEAVRVAPRGRHVAFEPIPALAAEVERAFPQVDCRRMALGARPGSAEFCHFRTLDGWSGLRRNPEISDAQGHPEYIDVHVSTLDAELGDSRPRVVKIDVEGAEVEVLRGAAELLARARPLIIFEHVPATAALYGASPGEPWELLSELDYEVFSVTGDGPYSRSAFTAAADVVNWLAAPAANGAGQPPGAA